jgi:hypothetical protein
MTVNAEVEGRVGWITLDRPPENRLDAGELEALDLAVGRVAEAEVAVAVIRSGSEEVFSAGADLREFVERSPDANLTACRRAHQVLGRFADEAPLFVAAIAATRSAWATRSPWPATSGSPPRAATASGSPRSPSACSPPPAAPSVWPA